MSAHRGVSTALAAPGAATSPPAAPPADSVWMVAPWFDLLFVCNLLWVLLLVPGLIPESGPSAIDFWQIYFITLPHRWITLLLVSTDPDRRGDRTLWFIVIAVAFALIALGAWASTGTFRCLALADYVWNYWHFASQHGGVYRIYSRKAGEGRPWLENWGLRIFVSYVALRLAGWTTGWAEGMESVARVVDGLDLVAMILPALLVGVELRHVSWRRRAKHLYLASVLGLYVGLLWAVRSHALHALAALTLAGALYHSTEYLAILTHYAWRRRTSGSPCLFQRLAYAWTPTLGGFLVLLGTLAYWAVRIDPRWTELWFGANLWASAVHYCYDGMIWKLRRPQTAQILGASRAAASG